ncbi:peptidyl-tRNA hydrolase [Pelagibacterium halotolerans]|uniref:peptidyl-tRNA hydrolase n=1 Tax=Pelagibacterium halotolerans TaxID=531813 RepID=UPI00384A894C
MALHPQGSADAARAGHGHSTYLWLSEKRNPDIVARYMSGEYGKVAVGVRNEAELIACVDACKAAGLVAVAIKDAAHTIFTEPTWTVGTVGPCLRSDLPKKALRLRLFEDWDLRCA